MPRRKIKIDEATLREIILEKENSNQYASRSALFNDVANEYNNRKNAQIKGQLIYLRATQLNLELKTPKGKKGRQKGQKIEGGKRVKKADLFASNAQIRGSFGDLLSSTPAKFHPLVKRVQAGSMKAAIKLNCLACVGFERKVEGGDGTTIDQIRDCNCTTCPLFSYRPYQK